MSEMSPQTVIADMKARMEKSIEALKKEYVTVRTGRASAAVLDQVKIDYYGTATPVNQVASVAVPDAHTLEIKPWDSSTLAELEKAILKANLGITPNNDGRVIRLVFPALTEDRRKEMVKQVHNMEEAMKVEVRNHRRKALDGIKQLKKDKLISEDDERAEESNIQKITDDYISKIEHITKTKVTELMEV